MFHVDVHVENVSCGCSCGNMKQGWKLAVTLWPSSNTFSDTMWQAVPSFFCHWLERAHPREGSDMWEQQQLVAGKSTLASFGDL